RLLVEQMLWRNRIWSTLLYSRVTQMRDGLETMGFRLCQQSRASFRTRLDKLQEDRLDGFIEPAFFSLSIRRKRGGKLRSAWRTKWPEHADLNHNCLQDGGLS